MRHEDPGFWREAVEQMNDGLIIIQDDVIKYCNPAMAAMIGLPVKEILGKPKDAFVAENEKILINNNYRKRQEGKILAEDYDSCLTHQNGSLVFVNFRISHISYQQKPAVLATVRDITDRRNMEQAVQESETRFRMMAENIDEIFWLSDGSGTRFHYISPAYEKITGTSRESLHQDPETWLKLLHEDHTERIRAQVKKELPANGSDEMEFKIIRPDGDERWIWMRRRRISQEDEGGSWLMGVASDITDRKRYAEELEKLAQTDPLTGLYNRRQFFLLADREFARAKRQHGTLTFMLADIDHFKNLNDSRGHTLGDSVLKRVSRILEGGIRKTDICARYGGEEFIICMPDCAPQQALEVAERLRKGIEAATLPAVTPEVHFTVSIGISAWTERKNGDLQTIIDEADKAMYLSKESGRNRTSIWPQG